MGVEPGARDRCACRGLALKQPGDLAGRDDCLVHVAPLRRWCPIGAPSNRYHQRSLAFCYTALDKLDSSDQDDRLEILHHGQELRMYNEFFAGL